MLLSRRGKGLLIEGGDVHSRGQSRPQGRSFGGFSDERVAEGWKGTSSVSREVSLMVKSFRSSGGSELCLFMGSSKFGEGDITQGVSFLEGKSGRNERVGRGRYFVGE